MNVLYIILMALFLSLTGMFSFVSRAIELREREGGLDDGESTAFDDSSIDYEDSLVKTVFRVESIVSPIVFSALVYLSVKDEIDSSRETVLYILAALALFSVFVYALPLYLLFSESKFCKSGFVIGVARVLTILYYPFAKPLQIINKSLKSRLSTKAAEPTMTQDELISVVDEIEEDGVISEDDCEIIRGAIKFADITVQDILIPRVDVKAFDINDGIANLLGDKKLLEYSRFPVYDKVIDNIIGILRTRDLVRAVMNKSKQEIEKVDIKTLLTEPYYVHMSRDLTSLLQSFREKEYQMAIVVDEYGGTMGIITAEDMIEEIVGDIFDEGDSIERDYIKKPGGYEVDGLLNLDEFFTLVEFDGTGYESDYNTVGGWSAQMLEKIPEEGDTFEFAGMKITVLNVSATRVERLMVQFDENKDKNDQK